MFCACAFCYCFSLLLLQIVPELLSRLEAVRIFKRAQCAGHFGSCWVGADSSWAVHHTRYAWHGFLCFFVWCPSHLYVRIPTKPIPQDANQLILYPPIPDFRWHLLDLFLYFTPYPRVCVLKMSGAGTSSGTRMEISIWNILETCSEHILETGPF